MPRGKPGKMVAFRVDPDLLDAVRAHTPNVTAAMSEGLRLWLARERRRAKPDRLAQYLAPPTAREIAARKGSR
jgi:hypothetical protein